MRRVNIVLITTLVIYAVGATPTLAAGTCIVDPEGDVVAITADLFDDFSDPDEDLFEAFLAMLSPEEGDTVDDPIVDIVSFVYDVADGEYTVEFAGLSEIEDEDECIMMVMIAVFDVDGVDDPSDFDEPVVMAAIFLFANDSEVDVEATLSVGNDTYEGDVEVGDASFIVSNESAGVDVDEPGVIVMAMRTTYDDFFSPDPEGTIDIAADDALVVSMGGDVSEIPGGDDADEDGEADEDEEDGLFGDLFGGDGEGSITPEAALQWTQWALIALMFCVVGYAIGSMRSGGKRR